MTTDQSERSCAPGQAVIHTTISISRQITGKSIRSIHKVNQSESSIRWTNQNHPLGEPIRKNLPTALPRVSQYQDHYQVNQSEASIRETTYVVFQELYSTLYSTVLIIFFCRFLNTVSIENEEVLNEVCDAARDVLNTLRLIDPGCSRLNGK